MSDNFNNEEIKVGSVVLLSGPNFCGIPEYYHQKIGKVVATDGYLIKIAFRRNNHSKKLYGSDPVTWLICAPWNEYITVLI